MYGAVEIANVYGTSFDVGSSEKHLEACNVPVQLCLYYIFGWSAAW